MFKIPNFKNLGKIALLLLLLVGFFIRLWWVGNYPPLLWDEAALGYNAYSVLETGKDEYGRLFPLIFKSFGDYKPGLYVYLAVPFIAVLGLNELAVRLPSVILGFLTPIFLYFLVREIFKNKRLAFLSALVLAFLPWNIHFSRGAWEVNVMVFFLVLGSWLFTRKLRIQNEKLKVEDFWLLIFFLALLTYQGAKMMVPLILAGLVIFNWKSWPRVVVDKREELDKKLVWLVLVVLVLMGGWYIRSFQGPAKNRLKVISLFSYKRPESEINMVLEEDHAAAKNWHFYLFHGNSFYYLRGFLVRYFNYFSPRFLAFAGDWNGPRHSAPYFGMIGHINFVLFLLGLGYFLSQKHQWKEYFLLYWLLVAPLPAALSRDIISGVRALPMVVPLGFFVAYGIYSIVVIPRSKVIKATVSYLLLIFLLLDFVYWSDLYFVHMVKRRPKDWLYGYKQTVRFVQDKKNSSKKIIFTDFYGQPYIYYLFYTKYSPQKYQKEAKLIENRFGDVGRVEKAGKVLFKSVNWGETKECSHCLFIFSHDEIVRNGIDKDEKLFLEFKPLGVIGNLANFYAYESN
jgi:4-amino-4-deoxy-L-arabinose transferase-like glycosyltransferase